MKKVLFGFLAFTLLAQNTLANFEDQNEIPSWAQSSVEYLVEKNIIKGTDDGFLKPSDSINRAEFCKIMVQATLTPLSQAQTSNFKDVSNEDWFFPYIKTAYQEGWVQGYGDQSFKPGQSINRAEVAKIIVQAFGLEHQNGYRKNWYEPYVEALEAQNFLPHNTKIYNFEAGTNPSRAEIIEQIYRIVKPQASQPQTPEVIQTPTPAPPQNAQSAEQAYIQAAQTQFAAPIKTSQNTSLQVQKSKTTKLQVKPGEKNLTALELQMTSEGGTTDISGIQVRKIGNAPISNFARIWVEINGQEVGSISNPSDDLVLLNFNKKSSITRGTLRLKVDLSSQAQTPSSSRFTLFLPEWINASTDKKVGFFPFGGNDFEIE